MDLLDSPTFSTHIHDLMNKHHTPGLSLALIKDDNITAKAFGVSNFNTNAPCTTDTIFDIASCSKSLTAASIALLCHDKEKYPDVRYDTPVSKLLPDDFVMAEQSYTDAVTVEDILSHRSGLPRHDSSYRGINSPHTDAPQSETLNLRNLPLAAPLRTRFIYNNLLYQVSTHLLETLTHQSFSSFLHEHFFTPLGMTSTHLQPSRSRAAGLGDRIASGHAWDKSTNTWRVFDTPDSPEDQGAGSVMTTPSDYALYVRALMHRRPPFVKAVAAGILRSRTIVDPGIKGKHRVPFTGMQTYALGWEVRSYRGHTVVSHDGGVAGFCSVVFFLPDWGFGACILGNSSDASVVNDILTMELIDAAVGVPETDRVDWEKYFEQQQAKSDAHDDYAQLRAEILKGAEPEPFTTPLDVYTGHYHNVGYHDMVVEVKEGKLFIDCSDRSMAFTLTLEHVLGQDRFIAHMWDVLDGDEEVVRAEFVLGEGAGVEGKKAVKMGLQLEEQLQELIWFDRFE